jgi:predicted TIM-barrel fold metal-dependent hydrolase
VIVDTHTHVIARDEARYPLRPSGVGSAWYRDAPCTADELAELNDDSGVGAAVLVQGFGAYGYDNSYALDAADANPGRYVSVAIVDAEDPASPGVVRELAHLHPRFTGIRLFSIGALEHAQPTWLDDPSTFALWEVCGELRLRVVVACLPEHLPRLRHALARFPEQPVVLDHGGFPELGSGPPYPGADELLSIADDHPNLHCKVTSHLLEAAEAHGEPGDLVDRLVSAFGASRLLWGSDWPQTHDRPYAQLVALAHRACSGLTAVERAAVLAGTALALWPELAP